MRGQHASKSVNSTHDLRSTSIHHSFLTSPFLFALLWLFSLAALSRAQTNPPPASYVRSYVNDIPDQPLVTVTVSNATGVSCLTIEEDLPGSAAPLNISGDGMYLTNIGVIRWVRILKLRARTFNTASPGCPPAIP
ncbi:MAG: hypothetical protein C5B50_14305 [Verrucomicrobia bacterium]|nr:MAG: hypothetical protein C5B50_14305 [Verrucomicrobiota bacterium]